jgi:predicted phosphodiesterase
MKKSWDEKEWARVIEVFQSCDTLSDALYQLQNELSRSPSSINAKIRAVTGLSQSEVFKKVSRGELVKSIPSQTAAPVEPIPIEEKSKLLILEDQIKSLKSQLKEAEREAATSQSLRNIIHEVSGASFEAKPKWLKDTRSKALHGTPLLFLSDIHFDEVVAEEEINFVNKFNREIATKRIRHTFERSIDVLYNFVAEPEYDGIVCALGGDLLSGTIHDELAETNDGCINESILKLTALLAEGIEALHRRFGRVFVPCVVGNHGRQHKKPRFKGKVRHNFEWLIYQLLAKHFQSNEEVEFQIPDAPDAIFNIYEKTFLLTHGDQFRGGNGISGIMTPLHLGYHKKQKKQAGIGQSFDIMMLGHFHQYIHTNNLIVNGSIKGYDEFANGLNFPFEPPQQALFINNPKLGMVFRTPILCGEYNEVA